jgi:hypothetical protein
VTRTEGPRTSGEEVRAREWTYLTKQIIRLINHNAMTKDTGIPDKRRKRLQHGWTINPITIPPSRRYKKIERFHREKTGSLLRSEQ